jgi:hypothetical protein
MSKTTFSLFILLLLTSCATSKFDFATAYKFQTIKKYPLFRREKSKSLGFSRTSLPKSSRDE